jgi:hypothetical protein
MVDQDRDNTNKEKIPLQTADINLLGVIRINVDGVFVSAEKKA